MKNVRKRLHDPTEAGFTLVEVLVSMMLLALLAVSTLPLLIQSLTTASRNAKTAIATQIVAQQFEQVRSSGSSCSAVKALIATTPPAEAGSRGTFQSHWKLNLPVGDVCSNPYLRTVSVHVWVTESSSATVLAGARKLVLLDAP